MKYDFQTVCFESVFNLHISLVGIQQLSSLLQLHFFSPADLEISFTEGKVNKYANIL